ncbi:MAG: rhomboid family intramembrane serine protease [Parvularculaceae bacterium]
MTNRRSDYPLTPGYDPKKSPSAPIFNAPGVVVYLMLSFAGVFFILAVAPERVARLVEVAAAVSPRRFLAGPGANGGVLGMAAPLVAHIFVHANLPHLLFNSLWLLAFGAPVARRFSAGAAGGAFRAYWDASVFLTYFVLCGAFGALFYVMLHSHEYTLLIGASGGVSGLLGGVVRFAFRRPFRWGDDERRIAMLTDRIVVVWTVAFILLNAAIGLFGGGFFTPGETQIAWEAHVGGYIFGLLTFGLFDRMSRAV